MTAGLETFAKVRALHDSTTNAGEKVAAAGRMKRLAHKAGLTVAQAKSKLDAPAPKTQAQAMANAFSDFFNTPEMRAQFARRDAEKRLRRAQILAELGSVDAVYAETSREAALRGACAPFTVWDRQPGCEPTYTLSGWKWPDSDKEIPTPVLNAVKHGWPMPSTVKEAWAEYEACERLARQRHTMHDYEYWPELWVNVRNGILKTLLATLPAASIGDMLARQSWIEADLEYGVVDQTVCATLRADIERMGARLKEEAAPVQNGRDGVQDRHPTSDEEGAFGEHPQERGTTPLKEVQSSAVQNGQGQGGGETPPPFGREGHATDPITSGLSEHVQDGQPATPAKSGEHSRAGQTGPVRRTNADKRRDVLALLNLGNSQGSPLSDRETARRAGVSPQTVGNIRRSLA